MAKYLKQNQIKAGITIYVVHPEFRDISCRLVTAKPRPETLCEGLTFDKYKYKQIKNFSVGIGGVFDEVQHTDLRKQIGLDCDIWKERDGYCGDDGIPDSDGAFNYDQERRAFPTLSKAVKYWQDQQTEENKARWVEERLENTFGDW